VHNGIDRCGSTGKNAAGMTKTLAAALVAALLSAPAGGQVSSSAAAVAATDRSSALEAAQRAFYNARYEAAAAVTLEPCSAGPDGLAACELRTAALLFQIKRALGTAADKDKAWKQCAACPGLMAAFEATLARAQAVARARLQTQPDDFTTLFLLGKLDLNYVWLQLGTIGRKTGWGEYWEGRRALDKVLKLHPEHVRARVARGWIDYIVDTKMPRGTRWLLGGGSKKRGLLAVRQAADAHADFFTRAEARFALWDMQVRERDLEQAVVTARALSRDFPENQELNTFIGAHAALSPQ
jgi:hypothetical protein